MSFYGNIKRVQSSPFIFDKYYPNRTTMDLNATTDNVYIGRYVLVKYTVKDSLDTNSESTYFDKYVEDADRPGLKKVYKGYKFNADKDIERYHDTFDGTVWQKIYTNTAGGEQLERYILIAELNSAVPRMELNTVSPMYYGENNEETWREPAIIPEASSEDAYTLEMPNVLQFDVGEMASDFYAKDLINPQYRYEMYEDGSSTKDHILSGSTPISHDVMLSDLHNYMRWKNYAIDPETGDQIDAIGNIDGKKLDTQLYGFGQLISDLYDALYGKPAGGTGPRPFYTSAPEDVLANYDKGLIGVLSSIATDMKGDAAQDLYARQLHAGMYYYFTSSWNDAEENPDSFIENIPRVIGNATEKADGKAHYCITNLSLVTSST